VYVIGWLWIRLEIREKEYEEWDKRMSGEVVEMLEFGD
jgi:hypothetical protein